MTDLTERIDDWDTFQNAVAKNSVKPTLNRIDFKDMDKATIVLMGDTHIGSKFYDDKLHKEHLEWCLDEKSPIILMGDNIEAATRDSVGAGVYEQQEIIDQQIEHFYELYRPFVKEGLLLGTHTGNHEQRVYKSCGVDIAKIMAKELGVPYFGWAKQHIVRVGNQNYSLYTTHGASGARLPTSKLKAAFNMADVVESEIYAMGHVHLLAHMARQKYRPDLKDKKIHHAERHFILTGHYLTFWGSYAHMMNLEPNQKGAAKVKLSGEKHQIRVSL